MRSHRGTPEKQGTGTFRSKLGILLAGAAPLVVMGNLALATAAEAHTGAAVSSGGRTTHESVEPGSAIGTGGSGSSSASSGSSGSSAAQLVVAQVLPGGPLRVSPATDQVALHQVGRRWEGRLGPIVVTDPRGTLQGWRLEAVLVSGPTHLLVIPDDPVALTGRPGEAIAGRRSVAGPHPATLMVAHAGGGGSFTVTATVVLPADVHVTSPVVVFALRAS